MNYKKNNNSEGFHRKCGGIFTIKMVHNPPPDIEAWEIDHGYPYLDKLEPAYYCTKEERLCIGEYSEKCIECDYHKAIYKLDRDD